MEFITDAIKWIILILIISPFLIFAWALIIILVILTFIFSVLSLPFLPFIAYFSNKQKEWKI